MQMRVLARALALFAVSTAGAVVVSSEAQAIPAFARQTGQPCASCHTAFPELTPFGRRFKLGGYTMGGGMTMDEAPPISGMVLPSFTKTHARQDTPPTYNTHSNDNLELQQASLFYGGTIYGNLGAFIQGTYDKKSEHILLDNTDIRYADTTQIKGYDVTYGITLHNNPTVQDVWNTTPAWSFPYASPNLAPQFAPPGTQIEGAFAGHVVGTGAYAFLNDMLYVEFSGYHNMSKGQLKSLGQIGANNSDYVQAANANAMMNLAPGVNFYGISSASSLNSVAPYWRVAFEPSWGDHSLEIGAFGFYPEVLPGRMMGYGVDRYRDIGFDVQYQYIGDIHNFTLRATRISETQNLHSSFAQGVVNGLGILPFGTGNGASNPVGSLTSFKTQAAYVWDKTISGTVGYFNVSGSADNMLWGGNSVRNVPDGKGLTFDLAYLPFSKGGPSYYPWMNAKFGISYTHYLKMYGGWSNFDGMGPYFNGSNWRSHNATDNNTLLLYSWVAF